MAQAAQFTRKALKVDKKWCAPAVLSLAPQGDDYQSQKRVQLNEKQMQALVDFKEKNELQKAVLLQVGPPCYSSVYIYLLTKVK